MPNQPNPTHEFTGEQSDVLALAGTVALPSPFPASARIFIGIKPRRSAASPERYYLKIVEVVTNKNVVTRLLNLEDFRAVRLRPDSGRFQDLREWTLRTAEDLHMELEDAKETLKQAAIETMTAHECLLFPKGEGVVYVPETAPVLVRWEFGAVAAEASKSRGIDRMFRGTPIPCCPGVPPDHGADDV